MSEVPTRHEAAAAMIAAIANPGGEAAERALQALIDAPDDEYGAIMEALRATYPAKAVSLDLLEMNMVVLRKIKKK